MGLVAAGYFAIVFLTFLSSVLLVGLFVPFSLGAKWALQARRSFCAGLALSGRYSFDGTGGEVPAAEARRADRNAAVKFAVAGMTICAAATTAYGLFLLL